ncbi:hypothetical protein EDD85DRAFT_981355 [Armillaria nabsnona]|nr:hypothetical protein EDD85DRAFT_981355 [Armillaria nabsnona]
MDVEKAKPEVPKTGPAKANSGSGEYGFQSGRSLVPAFKASSGFILFRASTSAGGTRVTRKSTDTSYTNLVRLVGLSAHYQVAATFLLESKALFYFDASLRANMVNDVLTRLNELNPCFRSLGQRDCKTAKFIRDMATEKETSVQFIKADYMGILTEEANNVRVSNLRDLLSFGFEIHHAGMPQEIVPWWRSCLWMDLFVYCDASSLRCQSASRMNLFLSLTWCLFSQAYSSSDL